MNTGNTQHDKDAVIGLLIESIEILLKLHGQVSKLLSVSGSKGMRDNFNLSVKVVRHELIDLVYDYLRTLKEFDSYKNCSKTTAVAAFLIDEGVDPELLASDLFLLSKDNLRAHYSNAKKILD